MLRQRQWCERCRESSDGRWSSRWRCWRRRRRLLEVGRCAVTTADWSSMTCRPSPCCRRPSSTEDRSTATATTSSTFASVSSTRAPNCFRMKSNDRRQCAWRCVSRPASVRRCFVDVVGDVCSSFSTDLTRTASATTVGQSTGRRRHQSGHRSAPSRLSGGTAVQTAVGMTVLTYSLTWQVAEEPRDALRRVQRVLW